MTVQRHSRLTAKSMPRTPARGGFTLVEVLVTLALSLMLLAAVYMALDMYYRYSSAGQAEVERAQIARAILQRIELDLRGITFQPNMEEAEDAATAATSSSTQSTSGGTGATDADDADDDDTSTTTTTSGSSGGEAMTIEVKDPYESGTGSAAGLTGNMDGLVLHVSRPLRGVNYTAGSPQGTAPMSDLRTVSYFLAGPGMPGLPGMVGQQWAQSGANQGMISASGRLPPAAGLARLEGDRLAFQQAESQAADALLAGHAQLVAPEVRRLQFRYFDGQVWQVAWDSTVLNSLPRAVEVVLDLQPLPVGVQGQATTSGIYRLVVALPLARPIPTPSSATSSSSGTSP